MKDDVRKYIYGAITVFIVGVLAWVSIVYISSCGVTLTCQRAVAKVDRTPIPTLFPATMPAAERFIPTPIAPPTLTVAEAATQMADIPHPSNPGGPGEAVNLKGDSATGVEIFAANCIPCHGVKGVGGIANFGSTEGTVPTLNPVDPRLKDSNYKTFATNLDLFLEHGSTPPGTNPIFQMPPWGSSGTLSQQQIADVIAYVISLNP